MTVQTAYNSWSASYDSDRNLTRDLDGEVTRRLLANGRYANILEIGCGTGKNTPFLAQIGQWVQALDFSPGMLAQARAKVTAVNVTFTVADLTQPWPCAAAAFDLVVCNLVLEHIENLDFIFAQVRRCLGENGRFFISELHPFKQYGGTKANFQRGAQTVEIDAYVHHISDFVAAAQNNRLTVQALNEWWHEQDEAKPPRLVTFTFTT